VVQKLKKVASKKSKWVAQVCTEQRRRVAREVPMAA
jgi:hypothetical protein